MGMFLLLNIYFCIYISQNIYKNHEHVFVTKIINHLLQNVYNMKICQSRKYVYYENHELFYHKMCTNIIYMS